MSSPLATRCGEKLTTPGRSRAPALEPPAPDRASPSYRSQPSSALVVFTPRHNTTVPCALYTFPDPHSAAALAALAPLDRTVYLSATAGQRAWACSCGRCDPVNELSWLEGLGGSEALAGGEDEAPEWGPPDSKVSKAMGDGARVELRSALELWRTTRWQADGPDSDVTPTTFLSDTLLTRLVFEAHLFSSRAHFNIKFLSTFTPFDTGDDDAIYSLALTCQSAVRRRATIARELLNAQRRAKLATRLRYNADASRQEVIRRAHWHAVLVPAGDAARQATTRERWRVEWRAEEARHEQLESRALAAEAEALIDEGSFEELAWEDEGVPQDTEMEHAGGSEAGESDDDGDWAMLSPPPRRLGGRSPRPVGGRTPRSDRRSPAKRRRAVHGDLRAAHPYERFFFTPGLADDRLRVQYTTFTNPHRSQCARRAAPPGR